MEGVWCPHVAHDLVSDGQIDRPDNTMSRAAALSGSLPASRRLAGLGRLRFWSTLAVALLVAVREGVSCGTHATFVGFGTPMRALLAGDGPFLG